MENIARVKIGYCPTRRQIFSETAPYEVNKEIIKVITGLSDNIEIIFGTDNPGDEILDTEDTADKFVDTFRKNGVDALFIANCNFGSEILLARVAKKLNVPVLLWGPRDSAPDETGLRSRDSQCGIFAASKALLRFNVPYTYLISSDVDSEYFKREFIRFAAVANVVKAMRSMRILQIGIRPTPFLSVAYNEGEILEKFGIEVVPINHNDVVVAYESLIEKKDPRVNEVLNDLNINYSKGDPISEKEMLTLAAIKVAVKDIARENRCTAVAFQCWHAFYQVTGVLPCIVNSMLSDEGLPVACETDVLGAVTARLLQASTFDMNPHFFADITVRHPYDDNGELLWHCGPFPHSLCKEGGICNISGSYTLVNHERGICEWQLRDGDVTIIRLDGDHGKYKMFIGEAETTEGSYNRGTYVWIKVKNWPKWERKLVEGPFIHHVAGIYGKQGDIIAEACKYFGDVETVFADSEEEIMGRWG